MLTPTLTRRNKMPRAVSRSTSEEIPISISQQQQYVMAGSSLADKHSGSAPNDMVFMGRDMVIFFNRK
jgi:hypothetical protein